MNNKTKLIIIVVAVLAVIMIGYGKVSQILRKDPEVVSIKAEFVGEVAPGEKYKKNMFDVKGTTAAGKVVSLNNFTVKNITGTTADDETSGEVLTNEDEQVLTDASSQTQNTEEISAEDDKNIIRAAQNGDSCEVEVESQGYTATAIVNITREIAAEFNIGYPQEDTAKVTFYSNGDLVFSGSGSITNFSNNFPWSDYDYTHVYIDEELEIENMNNWFSGAENLVYCDPLPKSVKTISSAFYNCVLLETTPEYFQCSNLKIMDYAFSNCYSLKEVDTIPVNVTSARYTFDTCTSLQNPVSLDKTSNLTNITGIFNGCTSLRNATSIPESVTTMDEAYMGCINIKEAVKFPGNVQTISNAYSGCEGLTTGASIPESVTDFTKCYYGCSSLTGTLEINTDSGSYTGCLQNATTNGDKLEILGNSGHLLDIQKDSGNSNITLQNAEAAAQQNERMLREQEG